MNTNGVSLDPEDYPTGTTVVFTVAEQDMKFHVKVARAHYSEEFGCFRINLQPGESPYGIFQDILFYEVNGKFVLRFKPEADKDEGRKLFGTIKVD
ncbi:MAG: hypothetical protein CMI56_01050 [Parcubacteria group bacterium]|nr:hypothetical protein [Parcubacteria group bacterium]|tara:strand:- start:116 stop:403 length:288 start_codon:yes stop_codon:yes gene_type:complete